jgi:putative ABC transport system permease protein
MASAIEREVRRLDPDQPVSEVRSMQDVVVSAVTTSRFNASLLALFGLASFALAAVGIYGVVAYDVGERTQEIGIRVALGAQNGDVLRLVLRAVVRLTAAGIAIGLGAAFALTQLMTSILYGVAASDFYTYLGISLILGAVALLAGYLPARRALAVHPVTALRHE